MVMLLWAFDFPFIGDTGILCLYFNDECTESDFGANALDR